MQKDHPNDPSPRLLLSVFLNAGITLTEIIGGILSNSLALISDAIHNLSDTLALLLAWIANRVGKRRPDHRMTFGYRRFEIISAFINASVLTAVSIYLIYEAIQRFLNPEPVHSTLMLIIAVAGLAVNLASMLFLHRDAGHSLNVKAAYLHLLGDTLSSVAVVGGAVVIRYTNFVWIDPALTLVISLVIIRQAYNVLRESVDILMQSTPPGVDLNRIKAAIEQHSQVCNVHHVHCWQLFDGRIHFEAHVVTVRDMPLSESVNLIAELEEMLKQQFSIVHVTLQMEYSGCENLEMIRHDHPAGMEK